MSLEVPESYKKVGIDKSDLFKGNIHKKRHAVKKLARGEFPIPIFFQYLNCKFRSPVNKKIKHLNFNKLNNWHMDCCEY